MSSQKEEEPRKATDILLSVEDKLNTLMKMLAVQDMNSKLILDRLNKLLSTSPLNTVLPQQQKSTREVVDDLGENNIINYGQFIDTKKAIANNKNQSLEERTISIIPNNTIPLSENPLLTKKRDKGSGDLAVNSGKKYPITQVVVDEKGKKLFMADVCFIDENGNEAFKCKVNAQGKYQAQVLPGQYVINITKTDTETKQLYKVSQNILVEPKSSVIELPPVIMRRS